MDKKIDELMIFRYLVIVFIVENFGIFLSIVLAVSVDVQFGIAALQEVYSSDVVLAQSIFDVLLIVAILVTMFRRQVAIGSRAILGIIMLALNIYLIYLCMVPVAPEGYTADTWAASSLNFVKMLTLGN